MRMFQHNAPLIRIALTVLLSILVLATPLQSLAEETETTAPDEQDVIVAPAHGSLQITLYGTNGMALSGSFSVIDGAGTYQDVWVSAGSGIAHNLTGQVAVTQVTGTADFAVDFATRYIGIVPGGSVSVSFVNAFLDADGDGIGDSVDRCPNGNDQVDQNGNGVPDDCDAASSNETVQPDVTEQPSETPDATQDADPSVDQVEEVAGLTTEVSDEPVVVEHAPVSCQQAETIRPWISSDLDDYPPGGLVTLTSGGWVPGQVVEILVEDDGIADAEHGEWNHFVTVVADETGAFVYAFNIAPWFVADYSVVATGECARAETTFTDSVQGGNCVQVSASDVVSPGAYIMFRCVSTQNPIRIGVTSISAGWQWAFVFSADPNLVPPAYGSLTWQTTGTAGDSSASGSISQAYFFLAPTTSVLPGSTGTASIQIKRPNGVEVLYTSNITAHRAIAATDFTLACAPASSTISILSSGAVTCTLSAVNIAAGASASAAIASPVAPAGWTLTATTPLSGSVTQSSPLRVTFSLAPTCAASASAQTIPVNSTLVLANPNTTLPPQVAGPSTSFTAARSTATTLSVGVTSSSLNWTRPYSFQSYPVNSGSLGYSVDAVGCSGWNIQVSASAFSAPSGSTISASNLTLTTSTVPAGTGISRPVTSGPLNTNLTVLSASPGNGIGSFSQTLNLNLNVPAGALVGLYTSIITVSAAAGP